VLAVLLADRRFDGLITTNDRSKTVHDSAERQLKKTKAMLADDPKWIGAHITLGTRLQVLGRTEEALAEVEQALANAGQLSNIERRRYGFEDQYKRALVSKSYLLFELGRYDETLGAVSSLGSDREYTRRIPVRF
jgi:tetratricopeptide (TPR) repeat protein